MLHKNNSENLAFFELAKEIARLKEQQKPFLNTDEAAQFLGISKSALYKLTSERKIPYSSPTGKRNYFKRSELVSFLEKNRVEPITNPVNPDNHAKW